MNNLAVRAITAIIGVTIIIAGIVFSSWTFALVFLAIALLTLREFYNLARKSGTQPYEVWGLVFSLALFGLIFLNYQGQIDKSTFWILPALFSTVFLYPLIRYGQGHAINCLALSVLGVLYIALPFCFVIPLAFVSGEFQYELVLGVLFAQWANDTGAYFAGKAFGKTKLFEKVSPKKTWEGSVGGLILAVGVSLAFCYFFGTMSYLEWTGLAIVVSIFGSLGDLVESAFKRALAIKDSGSTIPGHGGFLDRFDGLILALPFATTYIHFVI
ncbi:hypothetical protein BFP97_17570 [Roseivirga sp. 4D4]|nr:hypothetical protein BFP97_17570 [Roseivirga sp. 4D4]